MCQILGWRSLSGLAPYHAEIFLHLPVDVENTDLVHVLNGSSKSFVKVSWPNVFNILNRKTTLTRSIEKQRFLKTLGSKGSSQIIALLNLISVLNCHKMNFKPCWMKPYSQVSFQWLCVLAMLERNLYFWLENGPFSYFWQFWKTWEP